MGRIKSVTLLFLVISLWVPCVSCCGGLSSSPDNGPSPLGELVPTPTRVYVPLVGTPARPSTSRCGGIDPPLVMQLDIRQAPAMSEPQARVPYRDPAFGSCVVRVTDRTRDLASEDTSAGLKNEYSRVQSFNADGSLILVRGIEATWYLYDALTLRVLRQIPLEAEPRWHATDSNVIFYSEETRLMSYDIASGQAEIVHEFASDLPGQALAAVWTRYEGSPTIDGRYWGLMAQNSDWMTIALLVYDRLEDRVIEQRMLPPSDIDSVTISPLGNYLLAYLNFYCESGQAGDDAHPCGLMVYDRDLRHGRSLLRLVGHSDLALDAQGREVLVYQDIDTDHISMLDLVTGTVTPLWPIDFSHTSIGLHFSGRAVRRPGWVVVSTHDGDTGSHTWMDDQVFLLELKAGGRVIRLAHTHSLVDESQEHDYWAEPHASANQDLTRIVFTSNWGRSGTGEVEMFLIELPQEQWPGLP